MSTLKTTFCILLCLALLYSCRPKKENNESSSLRTISVDLDHKSRRFSFSDLFSQMEFIPLETSEECLLGKIVQLNFYDDHFFIRDYGSGNSHGLGEHIYVFDRNGKFAYKIGEFGKGPGEHDGIRNFFIDRSQQQLILETFQKYLIYDLKTKKLIKEETIPKNTSGIMYLGEGYFALYIKYFDTQKPKETLEIVKGDQTLYSGFPIVPLSKTLSLSINFTANEQGDNFLSQSLNNTIYRITKDSLEPHCYIDFGKNKIPEGIGVEDINKYCNYITKFVENKNYIRFDFMGPGGLLLNYFYFKTRQKEFLFSVINADENGLHTIEPFNYKFYGDDWCISPLSIQEARENLDQIKAMSVNPAWKARDSVRWEQAQKADQSSVFEKCRQTIDQLPEDSNPILIMSRFRFDE